MAEHGNSAKVALTRAIENKVGRMDMASLFELATTLKVRVPAVAKALMPRISSLAANSTPPVDNVLQGRGLGPVVSAAEGARLLDKVTVDDDSADWVESDLLGAGELVERLKVSRGTIDNWRRANKIVALRKGLRNYLYPLRQFERRRPVAGLDEVAPFFSSPEETWEWLVAPNRMTGGMPPIEKLRDADVAIVRGAAAGALDYA